MTLSVRQQPAVAGPRPRRTRLSIGALLIYVILGVGSVGMMLPLFITLFTSLKPQGEIFAFPPSLFPSHIQLSGYADLFTTVPFLRWTLNSVVITGLSTLGAVLSSTLAGYAFARLKFPHRDRLFAIALGTMMLPGIVTLVPTFILFRTLGWVDTFLPLIVPAWLGSPFFIFLSRQHFRSIPKEYEEAARVDGASSYYIWWHLMMPMSRSLIATIAIFSILWNWDSFLEPLIYLSSVDNMTLAVGLRSLQNDFNTRWDMIMAGSALMTLPMILLFFFGQRFFLEDRSSLAGLGGR